MLEEVIRQLGGEKEAVKSKQGRDALIQLGKIPHDIYQEHIGRLRVKLEEKPPEYHCDGDGNIILKRNRRHQKEGNKPNADYAYDNVAYTHTLEKLDLDFCFSRDKSHIISKMPGGCECSATVT